MIAMHILNRSGRTRASVAAIASAALASVAATPAAALNNPYAYFGPFNAQWDHGFGSWAGTGYSASITWSPVVNLVVNWDKNANSWSGDGGWEQWSVYLDYQAEVIGPVTQLVPIDVGYLLAVTTSAGPGGSASAVAGLNYDTNVLTNSSQDLVVRAASNMGSSLFPSDSTIGVKHFQDYANTPFDVVMSGTGNVWNNVAQATVFVDPVYWIDPSFAAVDPNYKTDYTIVFSPSIENIGPAGLSAPEPASMVLLGTGLAGVWARKRLRRA